MALAEGIWDAARRAAQEEKRKKKRRRPKPKPKPRARPVGHAGDAGEAAAFGRSKEYRRLRKRQKSYRRSDSAEAAAFARSAVLERLRKRNEARARARLQTYTGAKLARVLPSNLAGTTGPGGIVGRAAKQIGESIVYSPAGVYQAGKAVGFDVRDIATGRDVTPGRTTRLGKEIGRQVAEDIRHPGRNPGYLAMDVIAALSAGAGAASRVSAAGRAAAATSRAGGGVTRAAGKALVRKPSEGGSLLRAPRPGRVEIAPGVHVRLSRNALARAAQRQRIKAQMKRPEGRAGGGTVGRNLPERIGKERRKREEILADVSRAPAEALRGRARRLDRVEQTAVRVVAEGQPVAARIAKHEADLAKAPDRLARRRLEKKIAVLREVEQRRLVVDVDGVPEFPRGSKLAEPYARAETSGGRREAILEKAGLATREQLAERKQAPGRMVEGAEAFQQGKMYVPYLRRRVQRTGRPQAGSAQGVGVPRGNITHGTFTGKSMNLGAFRDDAVKMIADAELEAQRHNAVLRIREDAVQAAVSSDEYLALPAKQRKHFIPVRVTKKPYSADTREFLDLIQNRLDEGVKITRKERKDLARRTDKARAEMFPDMEEAEALAAAARGEVRFVDKRMLGGLNESHGVHGAITGPLATVIDEVNAASQIAILFLKPAYLTPNLVGQGLLALIHQGPLAPWNMGKAVSLYRKLSPEEKAMVRSGIGQGLAHAAPIQRGHVFKPVRGKMAQAYSKLLDSPFRWPAFLHEARIAGFDTPAKIRGLLNDAKNVDDMVEVFQRTRDAMIDYAEMAPWEQKLARRVIFFYPWVKGSGVFTARFARDHPAQAAVTVQLGREGEETAMRELGPVPWYARGTFKVGGTRERPLVVDPRAAQLFESPVQAGELLKGLVSGDTQKGRQLADFLSPAAAFPGQLLYPHDPLQGYALENRNEALKRQFVTGLPQARLVEGLRHPTEGKEDVLYPRSRADVVRQYTIGGLYPHPANRAQLAQRAKEEGEEGLSSAQRAYRDVFDERRSFFEAAKRFAPEQLQGGKLPQELRTAFTRKAAVNRLRRQVEGDTEAGTKERELAKLMAEAKLLQGWGVVSAYQVLEEAKWARSLKDIPAGAPLPSGRSERLAYEELRAKRSKIVDKYFGPAYLDRISQARGFLEERGAELD